MCSWQGGRGAKGGVFINTIVSIGEGLTGEQIQKHKTTSFWEVKQLHSGLVGEKNT